MSDIKKFNLRKEAFERRFQFYFAEEGDSSDWEDAIANHCTCLEECWPDDLSFEQVIDIHMHVSNSHGCECSKDEIKNIILEFMMNDDWDSLDDLQKKALIDHEKVICDTFPYFEKWIKKATVEEIWSRDYSDATELFDDIMHKATGGLYQYEEDEAREQKTLKAIAHVLQEKAHKKTLRMEAFIKKYDYPIEAGEH